jgi:hypothetical protein
MSRKKSDTFRGRNVTYACHLHLVFAILNIKIL